MKEFNHLQEIWNSQSDTKPNISTTALMAKANQTTKTLEKNQYWTIGIITLTVLILLFYFFWTYAFQFNTFTIGLSIMILMLVLRIFLEMSSAIQLRSIKTDVPLLKYSQKIKAFYEWRKKIHFILTPIIYISYFVGFTMLLPTFKIHFSPGFYMYCMVSGFGFFVVFGYILVKQIRKELQLIEILKMVN
ncbi:MAG: hypothetical protein ACK4RM_10770 [Flavobacterium sp.]